MCIDVTYIGLQNHGVQIFDIYFQNNLNYVAKFPNWSVAGCHGGITNPAPWFCAQYIIYPSMVKEPILFFQLFFQTFGDFAITRKLIFF